MLKAFTKRFFILLFEALLWLQLDTVVSINNLQRLQRLITPLMAVFTMKRDCRDGLALPAASVNACWSDCGTQDIRGLTRCLTFPTWIKSSHLQTSSEPLPLAGEDDSMFQAGPFTIRLIISLIVDFLKSCSIREIHALLVSSTKSYKTKLNVGNTHGISMWKYPG